MYIYYITRYYTKISLSTIQYYTMYCKNTKYTVYPRLFLLQLLCFCPSGSLYSSNRVFGWFYSAPCHDLGQKNIRTANLGQSLCTTVCRSGGITRNLTLPLLLKFNQQMRDQANGILFRRVMENIQIYREKICSLTLESKFFAFFGQSVTYFPPSPKANIIYFIQKYKMPIVKLIQQETNMSANKYYLGWKSTFQSL